MDVFHTSYLRANIVAWLPIQKSDKICCVGAADGPVAEKLSSMSGHADFVLAAADIPARGGYDYVINFSDASREAVKICFAALGETGRLLLAADNAYGMKFLAGTKDAGSGEYFGSVEAVRESDSCDREELSKIIEEAGFMRQQFYYPFPDMRFAMSIYSDDYLPKPGELIDQVGNFDAERLLLFDEAKAMDAAIARGRFADFSNSFLVAAGKSADGAMRNARGETISYVKFSNDRGASRRIRTYLAVSEDGTRRLYKAADGEEARPHVESLFKTEEKLKEMYAGSRLSINACRPCEEGAELEFLQGSTMEEKLDVFIGRGEYGKARERMASVWKEILSCKGTSEFRMTEEFRRVFGEALLPEGLLAADACDIDLIMPNILVGPDDRWTVIDYEWSFHFPVPLNFVLYRGIRYYADTTAARRALNPEELYREAGISKEELKAYGAMEEAFQEHVLGGHAPLRKLYREAGKPAYHVSSVLHVVDDLERRRALQIYFDRGRGFCEEDTVTYRSKALDGTYRLEIPVKGDVKKLRIDPGSQACTVRIERLAWKGNEEAEPDFVSNGHKMEGRAYLFDTDDPNILLERLPAGDKELLLDVRIDSMNLEAAKWLALKIDPKYRLKKMLGK